MGEDFLSVHWYERHVAAMDSLLFLSILGLFSSDDDGRMRSCVMDSPSDVSCLLGWLIDSGLSLHCVTDCH